MESTGVAPASGERSTPDRARTARARRVNRDRGVATRQDILSTTIDFVARRGARGVSLEAIAHAAGISKAGLLHHFPTKEALLNAALDVHDETSIHTRPDRQVIGVEVFSEVEDIVRGWVERPATLGLFTELLAENLNADDPLHERLVQRALRVHANIAQSLKAGVRRGDVDPATDVDTVADVVIAFVNGLETYWQLNPGIPVVEIAAVWRATMTSAFGTERVR